MLAENVTDVIVRTGFDHKNECVSPSASRIFGWDPGEMAEVSNLDLFNPDDLDVMAAAREEALAGGLARFRGRIRCKDGSYRWAEIIGRAVKAPDGSPGLSSRWRATSRTRSVPSRHSRPARSVSG